MIVDGVAAKDIPASLNTTKNVWYAIFLMFWTTWLVESWKRKESLIAHQWLMRDFQDSTSERKEFKAALDLDVHTKKKWMVSVRNTYARTICIGIPVSGFFIACVVAVQVLQRMWRIHNDKTYDVDNGGSVPLHIKFLPSFFNSFAIAFFGGIYKKVALWLVDNENHRQGGAYENSLINKIYMFQFINAYISTYLFCFWLRDFYNAMYNLVIVIVCIQVGNNVVEWATDACLTRRKIAKVRDMHAEKVHAAYDKIAEPAKDGLDGGQKIRADAKEEDVLAFKEAELGQLCEEQMVMKTEKGEQFVWFYNEAIIQLGFISFFAFVFPAAPVFSLITNFIEIRVKLNSMTYYSKRTIAEGARGIGSWLPIMELISMVCIPINVAVVFWTGMKGEDSALVKALNAMDKARVDAGEEARWSHLNIVLLLVLMEHLILALKIAMAILIPDVPEEVLFEESRNEQIATAAKREIQVFKLTNNHENFEDTHAKLQRDLAAQMKAAGGGKARREDLREKVGDVSRMAMAEQIGNQKAATGAKLASRLTQVAKAKEEKAKMDTSSDSESEDQYDLKGLRAKAKEEEEIKRKSGAEVNLVEDHAINEE